MCVDWRHRSGRDEVGAYVEGKGGCESVECRHRDIVSMLAGSWISSRMGVGAGVATPAPRLDQAELVRGNAGEFWKVSVHEVSVTAACRLGLGSRMATIAIRPWWQIGHSRSEWPVSSSQRSR